MILNRLRVNSKTMHLANASGQCVSSKSFSSSFNCSRVKLVRDLRCLLLLPQFPFISIFGDDGDFSISMLVSLDCVLSSFASANSISFRSDDSDLSGKNERDNAQSLISIYVSNQIILKRAIRINNRTHGKIKQLLRLKMMNDVRNSKSHLLRSISEFYRFFYT